MSSPVAAIALLLAISFSSGCSRGPDEEVSSVPDHVLVPSDSIGVQTGDSNYVFGMPGDRDMMVEGELSPASPGLTSCTLSVHDDVEPFQVSLYWVGPPEAPEGLRMAHTISMSPLGSDSVTTFQDLEAYYHSSSEVGGYLVAEDMNFDGYVDLRLMESPSAGPNTYWYYWLFNPRAGTFSRARVWEETGFVSPSFDPDEGLITSFHRDGMGFYGTEYYRVEGDVPVLIRSESTEYTSSDSAVTTVMELIDGEMKVIGTGIEAVE
jgi:hypothetical protein